MFLPSECVKLSGVTLLTFCASVTELPGVASESYVF
jgi:hypothetical protein